MLSFLIQEWAQNICLIVSMLVWIKNEQTYSKHLSHSTGHTARIQWIVVTFKAISPENALWELTKTPSADISELLASRAFDPGIKKISHAKD